MVSGGAFVVVGELVAIKAVEALLGADPDQALRILANTSYIAGAQPICQGNGANGG